MFLEPHFRDPLPRRGRPATITVGEVLLLKRFILEHVEDTERRGDRLGLQLGFEECLQFALSEKLLERPAASQDAIAEGQLRLRAAGLFYLSGHDKQTAGKFPCLPEGHRSLINILYHVEDEAEVHDIGRILWRLRPQSGIPAAACDALGGEHRHVLAVAAAEVEHRHGRADESVLQRGLYRAREIRAVDGGLVTRNRRHFCCHKAEVSCRCWLRQWESRFAAAFPSTARYNPRQAIDARWSAIVWTAKTEKVGQAVRGNRSKELNPPMIENGSTQGERLCNFLLQKVLQDAPWTRLELALAATGRDAELVELFREITAVHLTGRLVVGGVSVAEQAGIDSPVYNDMLSQLLREAAPVRYELEDELLRYADRAVRAARRGPSDRELRAQRDRAIRTHPYCYMCGVALDFEDDESVHRYTLEHLWPRMYGGDSDDENFLPACHSCNNGKKSDFATWAMTSVQALIYPIEPNDEQLGRQLSTVKGNYRFALHYRKAQNIASAKKTSLKRAFLHLGPWTELRVQDRSLVADFFNLENHRENLPLY
jgi:hypothetical protein